METSARMISLGFSDQTFPEGQHICYIYNDDDERLRIMTDYLKSGQEAKEKLLYLVDAMTSEEMLDYLKNAGIDFDGAKPGDISVAEAAPAYCPDGFFKTEETLALVKNFYLDAIEQGYSGARGTGEMGWCLQEGRANHYDLFDYEARLNTLLAKYPYTAC